MGKGGRKWKARSNDLTREEELSKIVRELETRLVEVRKEVAKLIAKLEDSEYRLGELSEQLERIRTEPAPV